MSRTVTIVETSRALTKKEQLAIKMADFNNPIDELSRQYKEGGSNFIITPTGYAIVAVHLDEPNANGNTDYNTIVIFTDEGNYTTGSKTFIEAFVEIWNTMNEGEPEPFSIQVIRGESKNYKCKYYLKCSVV